MNTLRVHKGVVAAGAGLLVALLLLFGKLHTGSEITDPLVKTTPEIKDHSAGSEERLNKLVRNDGMFKKDQQLVGMVFSKDTEMGSREGEFSKPIRLSHIKSLSPAVVSHVKDIFNDMHGENIYYATIPGMIRRGDRIEIVQRIWLGQYEKMKTYYRKKGYDLVEMFNEFKNTWQENHLYHMELDLNYNSLKPGSIMGVPTTTNVKFSYKSDGCMDPRLFHLGEDTYLVFHTWLVDKNSFDQVGGRVHIWDMDRHVKRNLWPHIELQRTEINWIPLDINGELYLTYSIDPLRVMKCNQWTGDCKFVHEQAGTKDNAFLYTNDHLRGGTPWVLYKYPYYISLAHSVSATYKPYMDFAIYNAHLVVLSVEPWRVVYTSGAIHANSEWLNSEPIIRNHTIKGAFWYPTGLILWDEDVMDISCHLNDASGHVLRFKGLAAIMEQVIKNDKVTEVKSEPDVRVVQQYVLETVKELHKGVWEFFGDIIKHTVEGKDIAIT